MKLSRVTHEWKNFLILFLLAHWQPKCNGVWGWLVGHCPMARNVKFKTMLFKVIFFRTFTPKFVILEISWIVKSNHKMGEEYASSKCWIICRCALFWSPHQTWTIELWCSFWLHFSNCTKHNVTEMSCFLLFSLILFYVEQGRGLLKKNVAAAAPLSAPPPSPSCARLPAILWLPAWLQLLFLLLNPYCFPFSACYATL